nr:C-type lectin domain-containing receptor 7 [Arenicola marina]
MECSSKDSLSAAKNTVALILIVLFFIAGISAETFYCNPDTPVTRITTNDGDNGTIRTVPDGASFYGNDLRCVWTLDAGQDADVQWRVQLTVQSSDLQWAPETSICQSYDYIEVQDGGDEDSPTIVKWCGTQNPRSITSTGRFMRITFATNDRNVYSYKGASLLFTFFGLSRSVGSCPMGWFDDPGLPGGGEHCYAARLYNETWTGAHGHCTYDQSNLVTIPNQNTSDLLIGQIQATVGRSSGAFWIGLNDIEHEGRYSWLDPDQPVSFYNWNRLPHKSDPYLNCAVMFAMNGKWTEYFCNVNDIKTLVKHRFICQMNKEGPTTIFKIPPARQETGGEALFNLTAVWVMCGLVVVGAAVGIIVHFVLKNKKQQRYLEADREVRQDGVTETNAESEQLATPDLSPEPSAPPLYEYRDGDSPWVPHEPPPSYDSVTAV